jgi:hypothetical protein
MEGEKRVFRVFSATPAMAAIWVILGNKWRASPGQCPLLPTIGIEEFVLIAHCVGMLAGARIL